MAEVGKYNTLEIVRKAEHGLYLKGENNNDILLPLQYAPEEANVGDDIEVFIYRDSEDRIIATTLKPKATVGEFAYLRAVSVTPLGAFLDWGLPKDLLVPFKEQVVRMVKGQHYVVYVYLDQETDRVVASSKVNKFLSRDIHLLKKGEEVGMLIYRKTNLGYKVIVNNRFPGMLYDNEIFKPVKTGQRMRGFIKKLRQDGNLDLILQKTGFAHIDPVREQIIEHLRSLGGTMEITDESDADVIHATFGISKRAFKQAIGNLYRERVIDILPGRIKLLDK